MRLKLLCGLYLLSMTGSANGAVVTVPTGLNPGDQYRLAFVTSTTRNGFLGIADANAFVDALGDTVVASDWRAIASVTGTNAIDNTMTTGTGLSIYLLNDTKLVDNYLDLWNGNIDRPLSIDENGNDAGINTVWTGTNTNGTVGNSLGGGSPTVGSRNMTNGTWVNAGNAGAAQLYKFYALSGDLTVPPSSVPEPSSLILFGALGVGGVAARARRRRTRVVA